MTETALTVRFAEDEADLTAAARLRYRVFVEELGGDGPGVDRRARTERDPFDAHARHLLLIDTRRQARAATDPTQPGDHIVGVYRLLSEDGAARAGSFYSETEYDIAPLRASGRRLLELGRSCIDRDYRGGLALRLLWQALSQTVADEDVGILFGVASFHGADPDRHAQALSLLRRDYLAPDDLRPRARDPGRVEMERVADAAIDVAVALQGIPPLLKSYLRVGGRIGDGAWLDRQFDTTDVCLVLDTARVPESERRRWRPRR